MKKKIYLTLFYFFTIFQVSQNLLSAEYQELDRVVAIVEKEVITEMELQSTIKQVIDSLEKKGKSQQYKELVRSDVLD